VENFRTSFDDLLSLTSVFNGDIRRALLSLQVRLETGSTCHQKVAAPVLGPNISADTTVVPANSGNDVNSSSKATQPEPTGGAVKPSGSRELDSGDEFVAARPRKRRALCFPSSDEDSQSQSDVLPASLADTSSQQGCKEPSASSQSQSDVLPASLADTSSQQGCEEPSVNDCENSPGFAGGATAMVADQPPVVMAAEAAPSVHRIHIAAVGGLESLMRNKLQVRCWTFYRRQIVVPFNF